MTIEISIDQVKRDISDLVNRVAYRGERVILTSRGKPMAVLVSFEDYQKLARAEAGVPARAAWLAETQALTNRIRERRGGKEIDVEALLQANRSTMEGRDGE